MVAIGGDADHRAIAHQGGIERDGHVVCRSKLAEMRRQPGIAVRQHFGEGTDAQPSFQRREVG